MTPQDIETVYDMLAASLDRVGPDQSELYLAKLVLALSMEVGDLDRCIAAIEECRTGLTPDDAR